MARDLKQPTLLSMYGKIKDINVPKLNGPIEVFVYKKYGPELSAKGNLYLKLILEDDSGKIQAMVYDDVEKQNEIFQLKKGYIIWDARVKETNQDFNSYGHACELIITRSTKVEQRDIPATTPYSFTPLRDLPGHVGYVNINIIGLVEEIGELQNYDTRVKANSPLREITIMDQTGSRTVSLWGDKANEDIKPGDVITVSPVKLSLYKGGLSVQSGYNSSMMINPAIPEADELRDLNNLPDIPVVISDSGSELTVIGTPKRKKRKRISSSSESSESELELKQSKNFQLDSNLSERQMQQKPKKVKTSTMIAEDSSDEETADDHGRDEQTQEILESDSNGSDVIQMLTPAMRIYSGHKMMVDRRHKMMVDRRHKMMVDRVHKMMVHRGHKMMVDRRHKMMVHRGHKMMVDRRHKMMVDRRHKVMVDRRHKVMVDSGHKMIVDMRHKMMMMVDRRHKMMVARRHKMMVDRVHKMTVDRRHKMMVDRGHRRILFMLLSQGGTKT